VHGPSAFPSDSLTGIRPISLIDAPFCPAPWPCGPRRPTYNHLLKCERSQSFFALPTLRFPPSAGSSSVVLCAAEAFARHFSGQQRASAVRASGRWNRAVTRQSGSPGAAASRRHHRHFSGRDHEYLVVDGLSRSARSSRAGPGSCGNSQSCLSARKARFAGQAFELRDDAAVNSAIDIFCAPVAVSSRSAHPG